MDTIIGCMFRALEDGKVDKLMHQANAQGVMGSGVAKEWKKRFPINFQYYKQLCQAAEYNKELLLGCFAVSGDQVSIIAQFEYSNRSVRNTNYAALTHGVIGYINGLPFHNPVRIGLPYLMGSALGGGDWSVVSSILEDIEQMYPHVTFIACKQRG